jgi:hypothetical protein
MAGGADAGKRNERPSEEGDGWSPFVFVDINEAARGEEAE